MFKLYDPIEDSLAQAGYLTRIINGEEVTCLEYDMFIPTRKQYDFFKELREYICETSETARKLLEDPNEYDNICVYYENNQFTIIRTEETGEENEICKINIDNPKYNGLMITQALRGKPDYDENVRITMTLGNSLSEWSYEQMVAFSVSRAMEYTISQSNIDFFNIKDIYHIQGQLPMALCYEIGNFISEFFDRRVIGRHVDNGMIICLYNRQMSFLKNKIWRNTWESYAEDPDSFNDSDHKRWRLSKEIFDEKLMDDMCDEFFDILKFVEPSTICLSLRGYLLRRVKGHPCCEAMFGADKNGRTVVVIY